ncbi:MAG: hypothetical protein KGI56_09320 [Acidobacteriota bacterium]|nr:hypothetical protein [Acidobacteriota bacterium]
MRPGTFLVFLSALAVSGGFARAAPPSSATRLHPAPGRAMLSKGDAGRILVWGKDIRVLWAPPGTSFRNAPLAFAGYGLRVPGVYDDLAGLGLAGHVAIIARRVPDLPRFARLPAKDRRLATRIRHLEKAGALGVILLEDGPLPGRKALGKVDLPVLAMPASALSAECGDLAARLRTIATTGHPQSQDFIYAPWTTLSLDLPGKRTPAPRRDADDPDRR